MSGRFPLAMALLLTATSAEYARAQTVQLPTFEFFGVGTTVVVPNQGEVAVVGRGGRVGMRDRTAFGIARTSRGVGISAVVHDLAALDRQALAQAARLRSGPPIITKTAPAAPPIDRSTAARPEASLRQIRSLAPNPSLTSPAPP